MPKWRFLTKLRTSLECTMAPVGIQSLTLKTIIQLREVLNPQKLDQSIMNRTGAPADCWLLCMIHASFILNHLSCEAFDGNVPLGMLYGVSDDISILLLDTFYQPVFYATHNHSYPSVCEGRAAQWI